MSPESYQTSTHKTVVVLFKLLNSRRRFATGSIYILEPQRKIEQLPRLDALIHKPRKQPAVPDTIVGMPATCSRQDASVSARI